MSVLRWKAFKLLSRIAWAICPEPHKSRLQSSMSYDKELWEATNANRQAD